MIAPTLIYLILMMTWYDLKVHLHAENGRERGKKTITLDDQILW